MTPERLDSLRPVIGTLAHNRAFSYAELEDYCYWRTPRIPIAPSTVSALVKLGYLERLTEKRDHSRLYYPTAAGWRWIERQAC